MDSLPGVMWHLTDAWARRGQPNIVLAHYDDLSADLEGEIRRLAGRLGITVPAGTWPELVRAATFAEMRAGADRVIGPSAMLKSSADFFRRGTSGAGCEELSAGEQADYERRAAELAPPDLLRWLHREVWQSRRHGD
jgi:aryl sulfotransferase